MKTEIFFPESWLKKRGKSRLIGRLYPRINEIKAAGTSLRDIYDTNFSGVMTYRTFTSYFYKAANAAREAGNAIAARATAAAKKDFGAETMTELREAYGKIAGSTVGSERIVRELYPFIHKTNKAGKFTLWEIYNAVFTGAMTFQTFVTYYHRTMKASRTGGRQDSKKKKGNDAACVRDAGLGRKISAIFDAIVGFFKKWE